MRRFKFAPLAVLLLAASISVAQQGAGSAPHGMGGPHGHQPPSVDEHIALLDQELKLSADQKAKIKPILEDQRTEMQKLRDDTSLPRDQRMAKAKQQHEATQTKIRALLNSDQQKKFDEMKKQMEEQHKGMNYHGMQSSHPGEQQGTPPPPPQ
jgi:Spy/CpxP family protein refolding chaperone